MSQNLIKMEQGFNFNIYNVTEVDRVTFIKRTYAHVALAVLAFVGFGLILLMEKLAVNNWDFNGE